jgi:1,4-dihydroxy-2-naphthoyl-CoA synthase
VGYEQIVYEVEEGVAILSLDRPEKRPARFPMRVAADMPPFDPWWSEPSFAEDGSAAR